MFQVSEMQVLASLCKGSFTDFVKEFWNVIIPEPLHWNWHMDFLCEELQLVAERIFKGLPKLYDLVINISPGSSKSTIASIMFPAWCWTRMPSFKFIGASYSYNLSLDLSRKCRDVIKSEMYRACFPHVKLREDQDTKGYFATSKGGQRYATSSCGTVTGMHGHCIGIDDPLDPNQAISEIELNSTNNWIKETLSSRKVDRRIAPMILIMQRLHQDDPTALFLARNRVRHICIPAELTDDVAPEELRTKYVDGLMDPVRLPLPVLEEAQTDMTSYGYSGQYLQNPTPQSGGMFNVKKLRLGLPKHLVKIVRYWDKAGTAHQAKKGRGAFTVGAKVGIDDAGRVFILDIIRERMDSYDREYLIKETAVADGKPVRVGLEQEGGSGGKESAEGTVRRLLGFNVQVDVPKGDKEVRADPFSTQVNAGNVFLVPGAWNKAFIEELRFFPFSTTKDQVDACAGAIALLAIQTKRVGAIQSRGEMFDDGEFISLPRAMKIEGTESGKPKPPPRRKVGVKSIKY